MDTRLYAYGIAVSLLAHAMLLAIPLSPERTHITDNIALYVLAPKHEQKRPTTPKAKKPLAQPKRVRPSGFLPDT